LSAEDVTTLQLMNVYGAELTVRQIANTNTLTVLQTPVTNSAFIGEHNGRTLTNVITMEFDGETEKNKDLLCRI
jgi:hypothetical protein